MAAAATATAARDRKQKNRLNLLAFLPTRRHSKKNADGVSPTDLSAAASTRHATSEEGDVIFVSRPRRPSTSSSLDESSTTSPVSLNTDVTTTKPVISPDTQPVRPDRRKRQAPNPVSHAATRNGIDSEMDRPKSMFMVSDASMIMSSPNVYETPTRDRDVSLAKSRSEEKLDKDWSPHKDAWDSANRSTTSYSSHSSAGVDSGVVIAVTSSQTPRSTVVTSGTAVAVAPPRRAKRAAPPPPAGVQPFVEKNAESPATTIQTTTQSDDAIVASQRTKLCRFEAPPPPDTPPPETVDLSTQVYITKRDSLSSDCDSVESVSLSSDVSGRSGTLGNDVADTVIRTDKAQPSSTESPNRRYLSPSNVEPLDTGIGIETNDVIEPTAVAESAACDVTMTTVIVKNSPAVVVLGDARVSDVGADMTSQYPRRGEVGWYNSRAEPEGASSEELNVVDGKQQPSPKARGIAEAKSKQNTNNETVLPEASREADQVSWLQPLERSATVSQNATGTTVVYIHSGFGRNPPAPTSSSDADKSANDTFPVANRRPSHEVTSANDGGVDETVTLPLPKRKSVSADVESRSAELPIRTAAKTDATVYDLAERTGDVEFGQSDDDDDDVENDFKFVLPPARRVSDRHYDDNDDVASSVGDDQYAVPYEDNYGSRKKSSSNENVEFAVSVAQFSESVLETNLSEGNQFNELSRNVDSDSSSDDEMVVVVPLPKRQSISQPPQQSQGTVSPVLSETADQNGVSNSRQPQQYVVQCDVQSQSSSDISVENEVTSGEILEESFSDVIQQQINSFLDAFVPGSTDHVDSSNDDISDYHDDHTSESHDDGSDDRLNFSETSTNQDVDVEVESTTELDSISCDRFFFDVGANHQTNQTNTTVPADSFADWNQQEVENDVPQADSIDPETIALHAELAELYETAVTLNEGHVSVYANERVSVSADDDSDDDDQHLVSLPLPKRQLSSLDGSTADVTRQVLQKGESETSDDESEAERLVASVTYNNDGFVATECEVANTTEVSKSRTVANVVDFEAETDDDVTVVRLPVHVDDPADSADKSSTRLTLTSTLTETNSDRLHSPTGNDGFVRPSEPTVVTSLRQLTTTTTRRPSKEKLDSSDTIMSTVSDSAADRACDDAKLRAGVREDEATVESSTFVTMSSSASVDDEKIQTDSGNVPTSATETPEQTAADSAWSRSLPTCTLSDDTEETKPGTSGTKIYPETSSAVTISNSVVADGPGNRSSKEKRVKGNAVLQKLTEAEKEIQKENNRKSDDVTGTETRRDDVSFTKSRRSMTSSTSVANEAEKEPVRPKLKVSMPDTQSPKSSQQNTVASSFRESDTTATNGVKAVQSRDKPAVRDTATKENVAKSGTGPRRSAGLLFITKPKPVVLIELSPGSSSEPKIPPQSTSQSTGTKVFQASATSATAPAFSHAIKSPTSAPVPTSPVKSPSLTPVTTPPVKSPTSAPVHSLSVKSPSLTPVKTPPVKSPTSAPVPTSPVKSPSFTPVTTPPVKSPTSAPVPTQQSKHLDYTRRSRSTTGPEVVQTTSVEKTTVSGKAASADDDAEDFSSKLVQLRANLRASRPKTGYASTRYTSNDLNARKPFVRTASVSSDDTSRYPD